jgi:hypothetical protein
MPYLDDLRTTRDNLAAAMKAAAGKPNVSFDGESYDWESLFRRLKHLNEAIAEAEATADGPWEEITKGIP